VIDLYPAIDLLGGRVVRLRQGDFSARTVYGEDPIAVARGFVEEGARWIHVVDLDAAKTGDPMNRPVVAAICRAVPADVAIQTGGGVRSVDDVRELVDAGVARVVMGSAAVHDPDVVARASALVPVAVGLDHRDGELAVHGWTTGSGVLLDDAYGMFPSPAAFVITDIGRDGTLVGPDLEGLRRSVALAGAPVIASGGVSAVGDIDALASIDGLGGVIVGRALYEGRLTVGEALARAGVPGASAAVEGADGGS
jgi:phosphoribosylformimino-5-aminoimidazole carboxamide ribotide isomerase